MYTRGSSGGTPILISRPRPPGKTCQQADPCASNPCANGGRCLPFEASYICSCPTGFHGPTCRQDVNECGQTPSPCRNGGTCHNEVGSFRCACRPTHTGPLCDLPFVPCSPSPCQNGGTCRPTGDTTHECACLPGRSHLTPYRSISVAAAPFHPTAAGGYEGLCGIDAVPLCMVGGARPNALERPPTSAPVLSEGWGG